MVRETRREFASDEWRRLAHGSRLDSFSALWDVSASSIGEVNRARGGWSSAAQLRIGGAESVDCILKRQQNFPARTLLHPIKGLPTLAREFRNLRRARRAGLPVADPLYFSWRRNGQDMQAILVLRLLSDYHGLNELFGARHPDDLTPEAVTRRQRIVRAAGELVRRCHRAGICHNCLYPKHLMAQSQGDGSISVTLLDLEKARWPLVPALARRRDLDSLLRRSRQFSNSERLRFWLAYRGEQSLSPASKRALKRMFRRALRSGKGLQWNLQ